MASRPAAPRPTTPSPVTPRRAKSVTLVAGILISGLTIVAWTQPWFDVRLAEGAPTAGTLSVGGEIAAGGLAGLGLAGLALVGALSIAGPVIRVVLGLLQMLIGGTVTLSALLALIDPVGASASAVTTATGEAGDESVRRLVSSATGTFWPPAAVALGVAAVVLGIIVLATSRRWPGPTRKYQAVRFEPETDAAADSRTPVAGSTPPSTPPSTPTSTPTPTPYDVAPGAGATRGPDPVADWDALSDGSDPTSR